MNELHELLMAYAPYIGGVVIAYLTYRETKRKTRHDELHELYEDMKQQRDDLQKQLDEERKKNK